MSPIESITFAVSILFYLLKLYKFVVMSEVLLLCLKVLFNSELADYIECYFNVVDTMKL